MTDEQIINELKLRIDYVSKATLDLISRYKAENERLLQKLQQAKAEAIKEFAEQLKGKKEPWLYIRLEEIDKLVKEMTEADK